MSSGVLCGMRSQLGSIWYAFGSPLRAGYGYGLLCAVAALVSFSAAQSSHRALPLRAAMAFSVAVMIAGAGLLSRLVGALLAYDVGLHMSTQRLLLTFVVLGAMLIALQV